MYKIPHYHRTQLRSLTQTEGESIELKVKRLIENKEPIKDGSPLIYTEHKDGVRPEFNIRTDRFELATEAMDRVHKSKLAKREEQLKKPEDEEGKIVKIDSKKKDGGAESIPGKADNQKSV